MFVLATDRDEVASHLLPIAGKLVGRLAWRVLSQLVKAATAGTVDIESVDLNTSDESAGFEAWGEAHSRVREFKDALEEIVDRSASKLVVIVDELDRCRPDYAIDMLNVVRHLFAVPGVVVVLGVNQEELEHRVVEVFGPKTKADIYLRRFVDLPVGLGLLDETTLDAFSRQTLASAGLSGEHHSDSLKAVLELMSTETGASPRDLQQTTRRVASAVTGALDG
ncbi:MAG: P-loop NTPase fold protein [Acidimicrobiaceae bacterium]|nr:P-loop NTPase fold protein [Acidimicrobiaceae bacterium]